MADLTQERREPQVMVTDSPGNSQVPGLGDNESRLETGQRILKCSGRGNGENLRDASKQREGLSRTLTETLRKNLSTYASNNRQFLTPRKPESTAGEMIIIYSTTKL